MRLPRLLVSALVLLPGAACSDSTGPAPLAVRVTNEPIVGHREVDGGIAVECGVGLEISVAPDVEGGARWSGGTLRFTSQTTGESLGVSDLADPGDGPVIPAGETRTQTWRFWAEHVYTLEATFRYELGDGRTETADFDVTCAPAVPVPAGTWRLRRIGGVELPARGHRSRRVHELWITVSRDNLTASLEADIDWHDHVEGTALVTVDEDGVVWFSELVPGFGHKGAVSAFGNGLMTVDEYPGFGDSAYAWMFERF